MNIHAPGNEFWKERYGLKIPVLYLYNQQDREKFARNVKIHELEKRFWEDSEWLDAWNNKGDHKWAKEELVVMDLEKKEMKLKHPDELGKWIWKG